MIQYYLDLEKQVKNIKEKSLVHGQIQKIYSTAYFISISIRTPGKTWHLYFGRGGGYEGIWLSELPPGAQLRRKDAFLEYLRSHLCSCTFLGLTIDETDRIVALHYQKFGKNNCFFWFWRGRKLYFLHHYLDRHDGPFKLLESWREKSIPSTEQSASDLFQCFNEIGRKRHMAHDLYSLDRPIEKILEDELKTCSINKNARPHFLERKKANIEDDLRKARQWEKLQSILEKNVPLEDLYELHVEDQRIKFEGSLNSYERRNLLFQKIKKLKRGESILNARLSSLEEEIQGKSHLRPSIHDIPIIKPAWGVEKTLKVEQSLKENDEYRVFLFDRFKIGVGTSAQGNDQLRSKWASREDQWIHLDGLKSAHGVLKINQGILTPEILDLGASIVAHFSHFLGDWIPIIYTQVKNVKGVTGAQGMVTFKKEKHLRCFRVQLDDLLKE